MAIGTNLTLFNEAALGPDAVFSQTPMVTTDADSILQHIHSDVKDIKEVLTSSMIPEAEKRENEFEKEKRHKDLIRALRRAGLAMKRRADAAAKDGKDGKDDKSSWLSKLVMGWLGFKTLKGFIKRFFKFFKLTRLLAVLRIAGMILSRLFLPLAVIGAAIWLIPKIIDKWPDIKKKVVGWVEGLWETIKGWIRAVPGLAWLLGIDDDEAEGLADATEDIDLAEIDEDIDNMEIETDSDRIRKMDDAQLEKISGGMSDDPDAMFPGASSVGKLATSAALSQVGNNDKDSIVPTTPLGSNATQNSMSTSPGESTPGDLGPLRLDAGGNTGTSDTGSFVNLNNPITATSSTPLQASNSGPRGSLHNGSSTASTAAISTTPLVSNTNDGPGLLGTHTSTGMQNQQRDGTSSSVVADKFIGSTGGQLASMSPSPGSNTGFSTSSFSPVSSPANNTILPNLASSSSSGGGGGSMGIASTPSSSVPGTIMPKIQTINLPSQRVVSNSSSSTVRSSSFKNVNAYVNNPHGGLYA